MKRIFLTSFLLFANLSSATDSKSPKFNNVTRADCSEVATDMAELETIAKTSKDMLDFLKKIPQGSLQGFTFVTNSLSLHRGIKDKNGEGQVSPMWPRVLRSSIDGKITLSFVCDPKNPTFGKVEIMSFDDKEKEFKTTEFDFGHPLKKINPPNNRIHHNPISCISCHGGSEFDGKISLKPNWPEYFQWSDCKKEGIQFYGGNDDNLGLNSWREINQYANPDCSGIDQKSKYLSERNNFLEFREAQKNNDCFNTLPWKQEFTETKGNEKAEFLKQWSYKYYPYAENSGERHTRKDAETLKSDNPLNKLMNYELRTNLRFTDTYSHLMAQRVANLLKKNPYYDAVKYLIVMEQAKCNVTNEEVSAVNELMPGLDLRKDREANVTHSLGKFSPLIYNFSKRVGVANKDWTMKFKETENPDYVAGIPNELRTSGDLRIHEIVAGEILKDISKSNPVIAATSKNRISRGVTKKFGADFSCIDDLGGGITTDLKDPNPMSLKKICVDLRNENAKNLLKLKETKNDCDECKNVKPQGKKDRLSEAVLQTVRKFTVEQIARGKKLVEEDSRGKCVMCHSASVDLLPKEFRFIPSVNDASKKVSESILKSRSSEISSKIENRLIKDKTMPPPPLGEGLSDNDREDIKAYLLDLAMEN